MQYRRLGKTGRDVSAIGFGAWAIGADWGVVDDAESLRALHAAADAGMTLIDTADVYGDGRSERVIGQFLRERSGERFFVATKMGRRAPLDMALYTPENFRAWVDRSRENLRMDCLDLVQLHCLPTDIYYQPGDLRRPGRPGGRGRDRQLRRQRRAGRGRPQGHRVPGRGFGPDHLQHAPPAPGRPLPGRGEASRRGGSGTGPAGVRAAHRQDEQADRLRRVRPSFLQPPWRGLRRGRDLRRRGLRDGSGLRRRAARPWSRPAPRWPRWPCAGS